MANETFTHWSMGQVNFLTDGSSMATHHEWGSHRYQWDRPKSPMTHNGGYIRKEIDLDFRISIYEASLEQVDHKGANQWRATSLLQFCVGMSRSAPSDSEPDTGQWFLFFSKRSRNRIQKLSLHFYYKVFAECLAQNTIGHVMQHWRLPICTVSVLYCIVPAGSTVELQHTYRSYLSPGWHER